MRVYGYVRVSTPEQAKEGYSIGAQTDKLEAYCKARGWTLCNIYTDPAYSGAKMDRPGLQKLIADVQAGKVDLVLVYKLDRLSRSQKDTLYLIEDVFTPRNVAFVSINENFDTSTAFGRAMVGILSVFAQLEREQIKERTQMGLFERAKEGLWKGGGITPIGYEYIESANELRVNDYEAAQVREIFDMFVNQGYAITKIQKLMQDKGYRYRYGGWGHPKTVRNVLSNNVYIGVIKWGEHEFAGQHQPLISEGTFRKAQRRLADTSWRDGKPPEFSPFSATQLLTGLLFCKHCGGRYFGSGGYRGSHKIPNSQKRYIHIYVCYSRAKTRKEMIKDPDCKNKRWPSEQLDKQVIGQIRKLYTDDTYFDSLTAAQQHDNKIPALLQRIAELDVQIGKMLDLYQFKNIPPGQIAPRLEALANEKTSLEREVQLLEAADNGLSIEDARAIIGTAKDVLDTGSLDEKRQLVRALIKRIDIDNEDIYITWRFM